MTQAIFFKPLVSSFVLTICTGCIGATDEPLVGGPSDDQANRTCQDGHSLADSVARVSLAVRGCTSGSTADDIAQCYQQMFFRTSSNNGQLRHEWHFCEPGETTPTVAVAYQNSLATSRRLGACTTRTGTRIEQIGILEISASVSERQTLSQTIEDHTANWNDPSLTRLQCIVGRDERSQQCLSWEAPSLTDSFVYDHGGLSDMFCALPPRNIDEAPQYARKIEAILSMAGLMRDPALRAQVADKLGEDLSRGLELAILASSFASFSTP